MNKSVAYSAIALALGFTSTLSMSAHAATLNNGNVLTLTAGNATLDSNGTVTSVTGSWWAFDYNHSGTISNGEKLPISMGTTGIVIGQATSPGASHSGDPTAGDTNAIDAPWSFLGTTGSHFTTIGITGGTESGLNMSGWQLTYNSLPPGGVILGSGAWQPANCADLGCTGYTFTDGIARFQWDGSYGHNYVLDYDATVPAGSPSGLGGYTYYLHLEGVAAVPEASTWAMMLAGLGLVGGMVRRNTRHSACKSV